MKRYACKRGLRSVPYIIVTDISMTTGAAVHLASMVLVHKYSETLLDYLPGGKVPVLLGTHGQCSGLIYLPNDAMGDLGQKLLQSAETLRRFAAAMDPDEDQIYREDKLREFEGTNHMDLMEQRRQHAKLTTEYSRISKRVRLDTLRKEGVEASDIWNAAFKMITYSRTLLMNATLGFGEQIEWKEDEGKGETPADAQVSDQSSPDQVANETEAADANPSNDAANVSEQDTQPHPLAALHSHPTVSYTANGSVYHSSLDIEGEEIEPSGYSQERLMTMSEFVYHNLVHKDKLYHIPIVGPFQPGAAQFEENFPALRPKQPATQQSPEELAEEEHSKDDDEMTAVTSKTPKGKKKPRQRKSTSANPSSACDSTHKSSCPCSKVQSSEQNGSILSCMCSSSFDANRSMVAFAADADGILTTAQQDGILRYATDWQSIEAERKAQGAEEYQQIWKLIDNVGCFTYSCS